MPDTNTPSTLDISQYDRILLVEDEPTSRATLSAYLHEAGYAVEEADDGQGAWDKLQKDSRYALVVTDRRMPRVDGIELALRMKKDPRLRRIPIIMQTMATTKEEVAEGIKAGVYYYLTKPYEKVTLLTLVRTAMHDRHQRAVFEQRLTRQQGALGNCVKGEFHIRTPEEAENVALLLGGLFPRPELAVTGLYELLLNGIEHGNLGIGWETKNRLVASSQWGTEIKRRLSLPENAAKKLSVEFSQDGKQIRVLITDEGAGFDWRPFLEIEPSRATQGNGRGIAKANLLGFDKVTYRGKGNQVEVLTRLT